MSERIDWLCDICRKPVENGEGWITVSYRAINEYDRLKREWRAANPGPIIDGTALMRHPSRAQWHVFHRACDPDPYENEAAYWFHIERARTRGELLSWTAHLMGKVWFMSTTWDHLIRRAISRQELDA